MNLQTYILVFTQKDSRQFTEDTEVNLPSE